MIVRLLMIPVIVGGGSDITPSLVTSAVSEAAEGRERITAVAPEERDPVEESARTAAMLHCGRDATCIARALQSKDDSLSLVVVINAEIDPPLLGLILVGSGKVAGETYDEVERGVEPMRAAITKHVAAMLEQLGHVKSARITVNAVPAGAEVKLDGTIDPDPGIGSVFTVRAGPHEVIVRHPGYEEARERVNVAPGDRVSLDVALEEEAGTPWIWIGALALAIAAGAAAAGIAVAAGGSSDTTCVCVDTANASSCGQCH